MAFDPLVPTSYPRIGETMRCRQCRRVWFAVQFEEDAANKCLCGDPRCHQPERRIADGEPMLVEAEDPRVSFDQRAASMSIVDKQCEFCIACMTTEQVNAMAIRSALIARGAAGN